MTITTPRLHLIPLDPEPLKALADDRREAERLLGARIPLTWPSRGMSTALPSLLEPLLTDPGASIWGVYAMVDRRRGWLVGDIGFKGRPDENGAVEIAYKVLPRMSRRGFAGEAAAALVSWALAQAGVNQVIAEITASNTASQRVMAGLGAKRSAGESGHGDVERWILERPRRRSSRLG